MDINPNSSYEDLQLQVVEKVSSPGGDLSEWIPLEEEALLPFFRRLFIQCRGK